MQNMSLNYLTGSNLLIKCLSSNTMEFPTMEFRFPTQDAKQYHIHVFIGRQSIRFYYQNLGAVGQAVTDAAFFVLTLQSQ